MRLVFKVGILLVLSLSMCNDLRAYSRQEFSKTIKKEFEINLNGTTSISNKHGKVDILVWDRSRVKVDVNIVVRAANETIAQRVFNRIDINFINRSDFVSASTEIATRKKNWWESSREDRSDYTINYKVYLPASNRLVLNHKFGDINIDEIKGSADLQIKHSNFKLNGFGDDLKLNLAHSTGALLKAKDINADIQHSRLNVEEVGSVELTSQHSRIRVNKARDIRCNSTHNTINLGRVSTFLCNAAYDDIEIDHSDDITISSTYSDVIIHKVQQNLDLQMELGKVSIDEVSKGFNRINLKGEYTDFLVNLASGTSYVMDAYADYAGIRYPKSLNVTYEKERGTRHEVKGHAGRTTNVGSTIFARLNYGALRVSQN